MDTLGVDVGGVITDCKSRTNGAWLANPETYLATPYMPGIVPVLTRLVKEKFGSRSYLISKCQVATQVRTMEVLRSRRFFEETGIPESHANFCEKRDQKAPIAQFLRLTHFIDDRLEVLSYMVGIVPNLFLFKPDDDEVAKFQQFLPHVRRVESADELAVAILG